MNKECKVILLPSKESSSIRKNHLSNPSYLHYSKEKFGYDVYGNNQHLYILSDDEIKEGDWVYMLQGNSILQVTNKEVNNQTNADEKLLYQEGLNYWLNFKGGGLGSNRVCKKIIATTNSELNKKSVASIDDEFIKQYCNKPVDNVLVDFNIIRDSDTGKPEFGGYDIPDKYYPKTSQNGSIIIKSKEETWDETKKLLDFHLNNLLFKLKYSDSNTNAQIVIDYLEENYQIPKKK